MEEKKVQITQDTLYEYLLAHDVKLSRLAELMGLKKPEVVMSCFKHHKDWHGRPRKFNAEHVALINNALPVMADELRGKLLTFGSERMFTNKWGNTYDPALVDQLNGLGKWLNITGMMVRLLGWTKGKKSAVFCQPSSKAYGAISEQDMITINNEILSVAGVLASYELVMESDTDAQ